ncbi:MAG: hypothetical protein ACLQVM_09200 [Terriglobia bacterium]
MTGSSGKGVDLEIYFEWEGLEHTFRLTYARVVISGHRPQVGNAVLETRLEVQRHSLRKHFLGFTQGPSLRGDVNLQAEGDEMPGVPEDHACKFEMILIVHHSSLLTGWWSVV